MNPAIYAAVEKLVPATGRYFVIVRPVKSTATKDLMYVLLFVKCTSMGLTVIVHR